MTDPKAIVYGGVDSGVTGALVIVDGDGKVVECFDAPTLEVPTGGKTKKGHPKMRTEYDIAAMARAVSGLAYKYNVRRVVVERIQPMPMKRRRFAMAGGAPVGAGGDDGMSASSALIGVAECLGIWRGLFAAFAIPVHRTTAAAWKGALVGSVAFPPDVKKSQRAALIKERARARALELFPAFAAEIARKKDHGRAEAALLAEYGRRLG